MAAGWVNLDGEGFTLDAVMPEQYNERSVVWTPEQSLMAAALADAVRRYRKGSPEAGRWLYDEPNHPHWPFSFTNICEALGLDPARFLLRLTEGICLPRS